MCSIHYELANELSMLHATDTEISKEQAEMGKALSDTMDQVVPFEQIQSSMAREFTKLQDKCMDLENHCQRQNLMWIGVEEGAEAGNLTKLATAFFPVVPGESYFNGPVIIDRAHRTLGPKPQRGERPHAIIASLHYFSDREMIIFSLSRVKAS